MSTPFQSGPHWSTASFGETADTSPMELSALGDHLDLCRGLRGRLFAARCRAEVVHGFVASHLVTTALGVVALVVAVWLVL
ncbi:hypothetical protein [Sphaerotilus sp.]|jgi:hypothetical protein|uniref:hypothetical protein n=1 Tax=Sphaerotilus sp. TaxID=2093942 RepID=UPI00286E855C|nr:hypothetical protein [Sphaerotilus sp.]